MTTCDEARRWADDWLTGSFRHCAKVSSAHAACLRPCGRRARPRCGLHSSGGQPSATCGRLSPPGSRYAAYATRPWFRSPLGCCGSRRRAARGLTAIIVARRARPEAETTGVGARSGAGAAAVPASYLASASVCRVRAGWTGTAFGAGRSSWADERCHPARGGRQPPDHRRRDREPADGARAKPRLLRAFDSSGGDLRAPDRPAQDRQPTGLDVRGRKP